MSVPGIPWTGIKTNWSPSTWGIGKPYIPRQVVLRWTVKFLHLTIGCNCLHPIARYDMRLNPNPPMDGARAAEGGKEVTGAMIRVRPRVDGRLAGGLQALWGAPMAACSGCGERDGRIGRGKRHSRTGMARVCGDVRLAGWRPVAAAVRQGVAGRAIEPGHDRTGLPKASAGADAK